MASTRRLPRVQGILFPYLREKFGDEVSFGSWHPDVKHRTWPYVNIRRMGGSAKHIRLLDVAVIELTVYDNRSLPEAEELYLDVREAVWDMYEKQIATPVGHICSFTETMGPSQFDSPFPGTWRIQGLIHLGIRPPRN